MVAKYQVAKKSLVFAVGRSRSVAVDFLATDRRSILTDRPKKRPKIDRKSTFFGIFAKFRDFSVKTSQFHVKNGQISAEFSAEKSTAVGSI